MPVKETGVDPAAKGYTDDLKSSKSNRGVRRPTSQESSITNQRRMLHSDAGSVTVLRASAGLMSSYRL